MLFGEYMLLPAAGSTCYWFIPSRRCWSLRRQRGTGRACLWCLKTCWRTSLTGSCLPSSWALEQASMSYVLLRRCPLLPGNRLTSRRSLWRGQWSSFHTFRTFTHTPSLLYQSAGNDRHMKCRLKVHALLSASRHTLPQHTPRTCSSRSTLTPDNRQSSGQVSPGIPAMSLWQLTCCSTAPSKLHRLEWFWRNWMAIIQILWLCKAPEPY